MATLDERVSELEATVGEHHTALHMLPAIFEDITATLNSHTETLARIEALIQETHPHVNGQEPQPEG